MAKPISVDLFLVIFFLANVFKLSYNIFIPCPKIEKEALKSFKKSLKDPSDRLSSWNTSRDVKCCNWKGVICSNVTGNVHELHLQCNDGDQPLQGNFNPSLLQLKHLKYLDVSRNMFVQTIPSSIGLLTNLEYLNLSGNGFYGKIPPTIGNLSRLHTLSLEYNEGFDSLDSLRGLSRLEHLNMNSVNLSKADHWMQVINTLPSLVELCLSSCDLNFNFDPPSDVNITSLAILDLSENNFESIYLPKWIFRQKNLVYLDLSGNEFRGPIPAISNITKLRYLNLNDNNYLNFTIPDWLYSCKDLEFFSIRYNSLQGSISNAIGNLTSLTTLVLSGNQLSGEISREILNLRKLQSLDLSENMLQGDISNTFGDFESLQVLDVHENSLTGEIPINLGMLSRLESLWLSDNKLTGNLLTSMGRLSNLQDLHFENNMLTGIVTEAHFANLTKLRSLSASGNHMTLKLSPDWNPPFRVSYLRLGSWNLGAGSNIPSWLETQRGAVFDLDLSNTGISGNVPTWVWGIQILNLSHNHLSGKIPDITDSSFRLIYLASNQFSGTLPHLGNNANEINLSNNSLSGGISRFLCDVRNETNNLMRDFYLGGNPLKNLHLGGNQLTGEIPDCWMKWPSLKMVNLGDNGFSGRIPNSIGTLADLLSLNLYNNKLSGKLPVSISNCKHLVKMDLSGNNLVGNMPTWIGASLTELMFLILRSNNLRGTIPRSICHLNYLQILDLSNNSFSGRIPSCVNNFTAMSVKRELSAYIGGQLDFSGFVMGNFLESASVATKGREAHYDTILSLVNNIDLSDSYLSGGIPMELTSLVELGSLNLSGNNLTGSIPINIGNMKQLESLDLSRNALSGEMPNSFSVMSTLNYLNVSCNNLSGRIPESTQLRGMDASSFAGNDLCGPPLTKKCHKDDDGAGNKGDNQDEHESEIEWLYVALSLGYAVGFSVFFTVFVLKKSWKRAYFGLIDHIWDKLYVYYHSKWL